MDVTNAAVRDRIAELNGIAAELRIERINRATERRRGERSSVARRPARAVGDWLIGLGIALGGGAVETARPAGR